MVGFHSSFYYTFYVLLQWNQEVKLSLTGYQVMNGGWRLRINVYTFNE
jgi:hypothetical protein